MVVILALLSVAIWLCFTAWVSVKAGIIAAVIAVIISAIIICIRG